MLFYLLWDRRTSLSRCSNSNGFIPLLLEPSFFSQFIFFYFPSCSSDRRGSGISRKSSRGFFYLLLALSFWNLRGCWLFQYWHSYNDPSFSRSGSMNNKRDSRSGGSVSYIDRSATIADTSSLTSEEKKDSSASFITLLLLLLLSSRVVERLLFFSLLFLPFNFLRRFWFGPFGAKHHSNNSSSRIIFFFFFLLSFSFSLSLGFRLRAEKVFMVLVSLFLPHLSPSKASYGQIPWWETCHREVLHGSSFQHQW